MPFARIRDLDIYYEQAGEGPDMLVISGTGGDLRRHPNAMDSPLTKRFRVTSYDQRGLGQTTKPEGGYTMANYAADAAALMDHLGIAPCPVLGISFGGMVAQNLAAQYPGRISRLALYCTSPGGAGGASYPLHELPEVDQETAFRRMMKLSDSRVTDDWFETEAADVLRQRADKSEFAGEEGFLRGARGQIQARAGHDCWEALAGLPMPVHLAGGVHDRIALPETMRRMAERIPGAELKLYDGGHLFFIGDPQPYRDLIEFLER